MNNLEQLAVLTAMEKAIKDRIKYVREDCNAYLADAYAEMGVEKLAVKLNDEKVGEFIVTFHSDGFEITNYDDFFSWALDYGLAEEVARLKPAGKKLAIQLIEQEIDPDEVGQYIEYSTVVHADWEKAMCNVGGLVTYMDATGPVVPGVNVRPKRPKGTMVRGCKPEAVFPIVANLPGGFNALMLEGAVE